MLSRLTSSFRTVTCPVVQNNVRTASFLGSTQARYTHTPLSQTPLRMPQFTTPFQKLAFEPLLSRTFTSVSWKLNSAPRSHQNFDVKVAEKLCELNARAMKSLENYPNDPIVLEKGHWYPADYYDALKKTNQHDKIERLAEKGVFFNGYMNPDFFQPVKELIPCVSPRCCFEVKEGVLPADALKDVQDFAICDCLAAYSIAFYSAVLDVIGEEKFNKLFQKHFKMVIGSPETFYDPRILLSEQTEANPSMNSMKGHRNIKKGQHAYFNGVEGYSDKFIFEAWGGIHVLCLDDTPGRQLFIGFGLDPNGETEDQINKKLLAGYNAPANLKIGLSKEQNYHLDLKMPFYEMSANSQAGIKDVKGFDDAYIYKINSGLINAILKAKPEEISPNFVTQHIVPRKVTSVWNQMGGL